MDTQADFSGSTGDRVVCNAYLLLLVIPVLGQVIFQVALLKVKLALDPVTHHRRNSDEPQDVWGMCCCDAASFLVGEYVVAFPNMQINIGGVWHRQEYGRVHNE